MATLILVELKLLLRSVEFLVVAIAFPAVFFLVMSEVFGGLEAGTLDMATYMMVSMAAFGAISGTISVGARVAQERQAGWNRQLRLTPLPGWSYVANKVIISMVTVLPVIALILLAGLAVKGVELSAGRWTGVLLASWLGALPFGVLGVLIGLAIKPETVPAVYVTTFLMMAMFGGLWVPVEVLPDAMAAAAHVLPSYWLATQARHLATGTSIEPVGILVCAAWFLAAATLVVVFYRRDNVRT